MSELWRARCVEVDKNSTYKIDDIYTMYEDGLGILNNGKETKFPYTDFDEFNKNAIFSEWELIQPTEDTLTPEEVIELLKDISFNADRKYSKTYFGERYIKISEVLNNFTPSEIIQKLTEYKKSKQVKVISKQEYDKVASDKLDEIYPLG
jgi:hypothetical protein